MYALTALLSLALAGLAAAAPTNGDIVPVTCNNVQRRIQETNTCTAPYAGCPQGPGTTSSGLKYRGTYEVANRECAPCPAGAWGCRSAESVIGCSEDGYVQFGSGGLCYANSACVEQGGYVRKDPQTNPVRNYNRCQTCAAGFSAYLTDYRCDRCPAELGKARRCTADKALSCKDEYVLYQNKCLDTKCPDGWYSDNGVCKTCVSQDPKSVTCELGKSLTWSAFFRFLLFPLVTRNQLLILSTNRCGTSACPYTPANGLPGSYRDGLVCRSCATEAFNCDAGGALNCYNPNGVQYYRLDRTFVTKEQCLVAKPTSRLFTQLQSSTGVTYGTC